MQAKRSDQHKIGRNVQRKVLVLCNHNICDGYEPRLRAAQLRLELSENEGIVISKATYLTNAKLEEMYGGAMFWFFTTIQAIVFDANNYFIEFLS